jgi:hypothetical protein
MAKSIEFDFDLGTNNPGHVRITSTGKTTNTLTLTDSNNVTVAVTNFDISYLNLFQKELSDFINDVMKQFP